MQSSFLAMTPYKAQLKHFWCCHCHCTAELAAYWQVTINLWHTCESKPILEAYPSGKIPPLLLAEHLATSVSTSLNSQTCGRWTSTVVLHEVLLARGIKSKLVKGYTIVTFPGQPTGYYSHLWVEACGRQFDMVARERTTAATMTAILYPDEPQEVRGLITLYCIQLLSFGCVSLPCGLGDVA
jgi:hypothetical protein